MKKTLFTSLLALCCAGAAMATDYVTTNGFGYWTYDEGTGVWSVSTSGITGGGYNYVNFAVTTDSINAVQSASGGAYTSVTLDNGEVDTTATAFEDTEVVLSEITVYSRSSGYSLTGLSYAILTDSDGNVIAKSDTLTDSDFGSEYIYDVWDTEQESTSVRGTYNYATISFDDVEISVDTTYTLSFYDANDNLVTLSLMSTLNGDDENNGGSFSNGGLTAYSNGNMTIVTSSLSTIPEPATATLSLVALAGLMLRRRRQA